MTRISGNAPARADVYSRVTDQHHRRPRTGRPPVDETVERRTRRRPHHPPAARERPALQGHQCADALGRGLRQGLRLPDLDDLQAGPELGGQVRKGERGSLVVYADRIRRTETDATGRGNRARNPVHEGLHRVQLRTGRRLARAFLQQARRSPARLSSASRRPSASSPPPAPTSATAATAPITPRPDHVQMPPFESFRDAESYYATLLHELTHWTRHAKRLAREFGRKRWGDAGYAAEELVAELGAAFLCADLGITPEPRDDHATYIASWLEVLKNDKRAIFTAAAHAQRAADFLHGLQPQASDDQTASAL